MIIMVWTVSLNHLSNKLLETWIYLKLSFRSGDILRQSTPDVTSGNIHRVFTVSARRTLNGELRYCVTLTRLHWYLKREFSYLANLQSNIAIEAKHYYCFKVTEKLSLVIAFCCCKKWWLKFYSDLLYSIWNLEGEYTRKF